MILVCPDCSARYAVPDEKVGADGRVVKCAQCATTWTAYPETAGPASASVAVPVAVGEEPPLAGAESDGKTAGDRKSERLRLPTLNIPKLYRARKTNERKVREAAAIGVVWAGMASMLLVVLATAMVFRQQVVALWPKTAAAYAGIGFPVNALGLVIEDLKAEPALRSGRAVLVVTGKIRNLRDKPRPAPPLRIALLNPAGQRVAGKIASPVDAVLPAHAERHFAVTLQDPPANARDLEVQFDLSALEGARPHGAEPALRGKVSPATLGALPPAAPDASHGPPAAAHALPSADHAPPPVAVAAGHTPAGPAHGEPAVARHAPANHAPVAHAPAAQAPAHPPVAHVAH